MVTIRLRDSRIYAAVDADLASPDEQAAYDRARRRSRMTTALTIVDVLVALFVIADLRRPAVAPPGCWAERPAVTA